MGRLGQICCNCSDKNFSKWSRLLSRVIAKLPRDRITLAQIRDMLGHDGLLLLNVFLAIVFLIPVSIPVMSTVFGAAILMVAISRLLSCRLWLPKRFLERQLPADKSCAGLEKGVGWLHRLECISRSHRIGFVSGKYLGALNNCALVLSACLLMAPFGLVPFSNTLPALAILLFTVVLLQRDGLCMLFGHVVNVATIAYFGLLLGGGGIAAFQIFQRMQ
ncbi:MAG: exopolysaccharide biosynthesis protein [Syntrophorhabdaceae bacterium]